MPDWVMQVGIPLAVLIFGLVILIAIITTKAQGWGSESTRIVGLTLVVTMAVFLVVVSGSITNVSREAFTAAFSVLGAVAGYLFGKV